MTKRRKWERHRVEERLWGDIMIDLMVNQVVLLPRKDIRLGVNQVVPPDMNMSLEEMKGKGVSKRKVINTIKEIIVHQILIQMTVQRSRDSET
ncbi:hypothetical protein C0J52_07270 [Blattella germanica]|nr:hypothetical protein C0J52_07270 [Blattella germanica]